MADGEIAITYEVLFEVLRREKNRDDLQELSPSIYADIESYVKEKQAVQERFSKAGNIHDAQKVAVQVLNTEKLFAELNERREKKILMLALYQSKSRQAHIQTKNMLSPEQDLFNKVLTLLRGSRQAIQVARKSDAPLPTTSPETPADATEEQPANDTTPREPLIQVEILEDMAAFMGPDMVEYGPYHIGETVELAQSLADLLIDKGAAMPASE